MSVEVNPQLVAACGIYCGACSKYKKGKCPGCHKNEKASWCKIRTCSDRTGQTCAGCTTHEDIKKCKQFHNPVARIFEFIFRSNRCGSLKLIKKIGEKAYAKQMAESGRVVLKK